MSKKMSTIDKALVLLLTPYLLPLEGVVALLNFAEKKKKEKQPEEEKRLKEEACFVTEDDRAFIDDGVREAFVNFKDIDRVKSVIKKLTALAIDVIHVSESSILVLNITREPDLIATICICGNVTISKNYKCRIYKDEEGYYFMHNKRKWYFNHSLDELEN